MSSSCPVGVYRIGCIGFELTDTTKLNLLKLINFIPICRFKMQWAKYRSTKKRTIWISGFNSLFVVSSLTSRKCFIEFPNPSFYWASEWVWEFAGGVHVNSLFCNIYFYIHSRVNCVFRLWTVRVTIGYRNLSTIILILLLKFRWSSTSMRSIWTHLPWTVLQQNNSKFSFLFAHFYRIPCLSHSVT